LLITPVKVKLFESPGKAGGLPISITGQMPAVVEKKPGLMNPAELTQGTVTEWVETATRAERETSNQRVDGPAAPNNGKAEIIFTPDFKYRPLTWGKGWKYGLQILWRMFSPQTV
jgi:hypothetical protein